ncbi:hypothetical protein HMPREF7215_1292 [Pyramidobacter piscolens W5455]|uniref:Uncharacterized protein n=1 Tax=Pyramidobacter piscolens W5455 TaxID=352165 RepID=A0ABM9ZTH8_9BACT|nr:hypothetical protein HMPREF7215_1292 [Pyramidobacter piscolens W5455]
MRKKQGQTKAAAKTQRREEKRKTNGRPAAFRFQLFLRVFVSSRRLFVLWTRLYDLVFMIKQPIK